VMQVALSSDNSFMARGGMDNTVSIDNMKEINEGKVALKGQYAKHDGYISGLQFLDGGKLLSTSGDGYGYMWDLSKGKDIMCLKGHEQDISGLAWCAAKPNIVCTSSTDKTVRTWDLNTGKCVRIFTAKYSANCVAMYPTGTGVACGCDSASWEFYDIGCYNQVARGKVKKGRCESICFSSSGRQTWLGWDNNMLVQADTFWVDKQKNVPDAHTDSVCSLACAPDGSAIASSSFDKTCKIWGAPEA